ncbi:hypothetical protein LCGC14_1998640, partial [marine sediment metagenome]
MSRRDKEDYLLLLEERNRRLAEDPLHTFVPNGASQKAFINSTKPEAWAITANRWGKTRALAYIASRAFREGMEWMGVKTKPSIMSDGTLVYDHAAAIWVSSLDHDHSRDTFQPYIFDNLFRAPGSDEPFIPPREIKRWYADERKTLVGKNGSLMTFKSVEAGRAKYSGSGKDLAVLDEEHPQDIFEEILIRVPAGKRLYIRGGATLLPPEGYVGGVTWLYTEIIQKFLAGNLPDVDVFGGSIYDNPHLEESELQRLEARYPEGPLKRIRLGGEWISGISGARAYPNFAEPIHVSSNIKIRDRWPLCWAMDFNVDPMASIIGQYIPVEAGRYLFYVYDEIVIEGGATPNDSAKEFRRRYPTHSAEIWIYGDATGKRRGQTAKSNYTLVMETMRGYPVEVRQKVPEENPLVRDRVNAVNTALSSSDGFVGVILHPRVIDLKADLNQVVLDKMGQIKKASNNKDPYSRRTHTSDAFGYWIVYE